MDDIIPEDTAGPGTLRVFTYLITFTAMVVLLGSAIAIAYDIHWVLDIGTWMANNTGFLLTVASPIALGAFLYRVAKSRQEQ